MAHLFSSPPDIRDEIGKKQYLRLEENYRKYFMEIRKFGTFPMNLSYSNVLDFITWLEKIKENEQ